MWFACFISIIGIFLFYNFYWKRKNLPPGPIPFPLIGNLYDIASNPPGYAIFEKWRKQYGEVYTYWIYGKPIIAVNDYNLIHEHFVKDGDSFSGRSDWGYHMAWLRGGKYGISLIDGEPWIEHRKFIIQVFKNLGMGKGVMEQKIQAELKLFQEEIFEMMKSKNEMEIDPIPLIDRTIANAINQMLFGFSFHSEKQKEIYWKLKQCLTEFQNMITWPSISFALMSPWIFSSLPFFNQRMAKFKATYDTMIAHFVQWIDDHKLDMTNQSFTDIEAKDYVEAYLRQISINNSFENPYFTETYLKNILFDLWIAGQETTANNCIFSILYLLNNLKIQEKLHSELDKIIVSNRQITMADKNSLIYVNAFINEVQRSINLLPQNMFHKTMNDTKVGNYFIKKGTTIIPQISSVLYDEKIFPEPHKFKPERFIDEENGELKKVEELIPFSIGKRQCLGEALARMQLFLFIANFYNQFEVHPIDSKNIPTLTKIPGISIQPTPFKCILKKRFI